MLHVESVVKFEVSVGKCSGALCTHTNVDVDVGILEVLGTGGLMG